MEIEKICRDILDKNADAVRKYKEGKEKIFYSFKGQVKKVTEGKVNMTLVIITLKELLKR